MSCKLLCALLLSGLTAILADTAFDGVLQQHQRTLEIFWNARQQLSIDTYTAQDDICFIWYFGVVNENMRVHQELLDECQMGAIESKEKLNAQGNDTRYELTKRGNNLCRDLKDCEQEYDLLAFYYCYWKYTSTYTPDIYDMSRDTNERYNSLAAEYKKIDENKVACDENAHSYYMKMSAESEWDLSKCRDGKGVPSTTNATPPKQ